jgi:hypothetical protein
METPSRGGGHVRLASRSPKTRSAGERTPYVRVGATGGMEGPLSSLT